MEAFGRFVFGLLVIAGATCIRALILRDLWVWWMAPLAHQMLGLTPTPTLSFVQALAITFCLLFTRSVSGHSQFAVWEQVAIEIKPELKALKKAEFVYTCSAIGSLFLLWLICWLLAFVVVIP